MVRLSTVVAAFVLALSAAALLVLAPVAGAAEQANKITTRAVAEPLKKAQQAMSRKQWDTALAEIEKAQAVGSKTPFEAYQLDEFLGYVLLQQKKFAAAAPVFERTLNSGFLPAAKVDERTRTVAQLYFTLRDYRKTVEWSKKWRDKYPNELEAAVLLGQSYYLLNDFKSAAATMTSAVDQAQRAGQKPKEDWLKIILTSQFRLDNRDGRSQALKKMVRHYPKTEYWANLLDLYRHADASDRITLGYYRLMNEVGVLKDQADYMEMAQLAMDAGVPGEARQIVERGFQNGTLKSSNKTEQGRYDRLLAAARKQAAADAASLAQLAKETEKTTVGQADVALGQAYLSYGNYDAAIAALQRGIGKGGVTHLDEARISLGIAHLKKGQKDLASRAFKAVRNGSEWQDLAELWQIRVATANGA